MISFFRRLFSTKLGAVLAILFVGLIGFAFAVADINAPGGMFSNGDGETVATVGGETLSSGTVRDTVQRAVLQARQENPGIDASAFVESGGLDDVIEEHTRALALTAFADDNGLLIGKRLVDTEISRAPAFQGLSGGFDESTFRQALAAQNTSEEQAREQFFNQVLGTLLLGPVMDGARISETVARPYAAILVQNRTGQLAAVPSRVMPQGDQPTSAELNAFYQDNILRYTLPERRAVRYAIFSRGQLTVPEPTAEQIREYYDANSDEYAAGESRTIRQIILPEQAQAQAFYSEVRDGTSFTAAATSRGFSETATRLADTTEDSYAGRSSESIAEAAFAANEGAILVPAQSGLGWHVVQVEGVDARAATPLSAVRGDIVTTLREQLSIETLGEFYREIQDAVDNGASFEEIVEQKNLTIVSTPLLTPAGRDPQQPARQPRPEIAPILEAANLMVEEDDPMIAEIETNQRFAVVDLVNISPSGPQPLARIRELVTRQFIAERAADRAEEVANAIVERINGGATLSAALTETDEPLPPAQAIRANGLQIAQMGQNVPAPLQLMFSMAENSAKLIRLPQNQGFFVVVLESIQADMEALSDEMLAQARLQLGRTTANEYAEQFVNAVLAEYPTERDEEAIETLANELTGSSS